MTTREAYAKRRHQEQNNIHLARGKYKRKAKQVFNDKSRKGAFAQVLKYRLIQWKNNFWRRGSDQSLRFSKAYSSSQEQDKKKKI